MAGNSTVLSHIKGHGLLNEAKAGIDKEAVPETGIQTVILDIRWKISTSGT